MKPSDCLTMTLDRSDEIKGDSVNVRFGWRSPRHLWLYCHLMGVPPTALRMPGHDPPVAWREEPVLGLKLIAAPHLRGPIFASPFAAVGEAVVLEGEPGRSPARP